MTSETVNSNPSPARRQKPRAEIVRNGSAAGPETSRQQRRFLARKSAILDAALSLFSQSGLRGVSAEQIAEAADVSKTNLFYYFSSKEEIYVGVLKRLLSDWLAPLDALDPQADPIQAIGDYVRLKMEMSRADPHSSRLFCLEIVQGAPMIGDELRTSLKTLVDRKAAVIRRWSEDGKIAPVDPHHLIYAIWAMTQHYADFSAQIAAVSGRTLDDELFFREATENVLRVILGALSTDAGAKSPQGAA
ncbi:HTH-type transcriptional regulator RutR [Chelatococcus sambhunathii]|uniref:HTH-type transcriptional regulator RutR n=1 Tax=Chelatococcus sambhunathii TaxID=363953 RepID=UPI00285293BA|nr:HTH-type transcriptional regulator RutR [Chelatococcus sambhunathii]